jgi:hypothetical protein
MQTELSIKHPFDHAWKNPIESMKSWGKNQLRLKGRNLIFLLENIILYANELISN